MKWEVRLWGGVYKFRYWIDFLGFINYFEFFKFMREV